MTKWKQQICHHRFLHRPVPYYDNSPATFHLELLIYGDINPNPGPETVTISNTGTTLSHVRVISYTRDKLLNIRNSCNVKATTLPNLVWTHVVCRGRAV